MSLPGFVQAAPGGSQLRLNVQPRASRDGIGPPEGGELRVRVTAPPVDSAANDAVCRLLAETLGCRRGAIQLTRGQASRHKVVQVTGLTPGQILERLRAA